MKITDKIAIMQAYLAGAPVEFKSVDDRDDWTVSNNLAFNNWDVYNYRIKPQAIIATYPVELRPGGLQIGCTFVTNDEVRLAFSLIAK